MQCKMWGKTRGITAVHYLGMSPCSGLVQLEYLIQLSYTDVDSIPAALTWTTNTFSCSSLLKLLEKNLLG